MSGEVIYLPQRDNPLTGIGQGLTSVADMLQNLGHGQVVKDTLAKAQTIPDPTQRAHFIIQALGPEEGGKIVQSQQQVDEHALTMQLAQAQIQNAKYEEQIKKAEADNAPQEQIAKLRMVQAQTDAQVAEAASRRAETSQVIPAQAAELRARTNAANMEAQATKAQLDGLKNLRESLGQGHDDEATAAKATSPGAVAEAAAPGPKITPESTKSVADFLLGKINDASKVTPPGFVPQQGMGDPRTHLTEADKFALQSASTLPEALKVVKDATKLSAPKDIPLAGGFIQRVSTYPDGSEVAIGKPFYKPVKSNEQDQKADQGALLWLYTTNAIHQLSQQKEIPSLLKRDIVSMIPNGIDASWLDSTGDTRGWDAIHQHAPIAASQLLAARGNKWNQQMLADTISKPTDSAEVVKRKYAASMALGSEIISDRVRDYITRGIKVPQALADYYLGHGLDKISDADFEASNALGIPPEAGAAARLKEKSGDGIGSPPGDVSEPRAIEGSPPGSAGESEGPSPGESNDIKPLVVQGKLVTPDALRAFAAAHKITPEEATKALNGATGGN